MKLSLFILSAVILASLSTIAKADGPFEGPSAVGSGGGGTVSGSGVTNALGFSPVNPSTLNFYDVKQNFGAVGDGKLSNTARMISNSPVLITTDSPFVSGDVGKVITVYGGGRKPAGFTTTNQALNLTGTILSFQSANQVTLNTNCQQNVTNKVAVWGTDDTTAIITGLHYVCTNGNLQGGTLYFPAGIYVVNGAPFDTNMTGINQGGVDGFHEPKNAQIYFPEVPPNAFPMIHAIPVMVDGPAPGPFINQANQSIDHTWTNKGAIIWSTRADLNGASVISCIGTNSTTAVYSNPSFRFFDGVGETNRFYALPYHVDIRHVTIRTCANPTGPALNLCGAGTAVLKDMMIDSGYNIYNNRGKPMNTNGYGFIGATPSSSGATIIENVVISGFYTGMLLPEHLYARGLYIYSSLYGIEVSSGHQAVLDADMEDVSAWLNNRNHSICWLYGSIIGENNPYDASVWSVPGILITNDTTSAIGGFLAINNSIYGASNMPIQSASIPSILLLNTQARPARYYTPAYYTTNVTIGGNLIVTNITDTGNSSVRLGNANPFFNDSGGTQQGDITLNGASETGWTFGFNGNATDFSPAYSFRIKDRAFFLNKTLWYVDHTGDMGVISNSIANSFRSVATNRVAITATGYTNTLTINGSAVDVDVYFKAATAALQDNNGTVIHTYTTLTTEDTCAKMKPNWRLVGTSMVGDAVAH